VIRQRELPTPQQHLDLAARKGHIVVLFCDEAQRLSQNSYEWLRDVHDQLAYLPKIREADLVEARRLNEPSASRSNNAAGTTLTSTGWNAALRVAWFRQLVRGAAFSLPHQTHRQ